MVLVKQYVKQVLRYPRQGWYQVILPAFEPVQVKFDSSLSTGTTFKIYRREILSWVQGDPIDLSYFTDIAGLYKSVPDTFGSDELVQAVTIQEGANIVEHIVASGDVSKDFQYGYKIDSDPIIYCPNPISIENGFTMAQAASVSLSTVKANPGILKNVFHYLMVPRVQFTTLDIKADWNNLMDILGAQDDDLTGLSFPGMDLGLNKFPDTNGYSFYPDKVILPILGGLLYLDIWDVIFTIWLTMKFKPVMEMLPQLDIYGIKVPEWRVMPAILYWVTRDVELPWLKDFLPIGLNQKFSSTPGAPNVKDSLYTFFVAYMIYRAAKAFGGAAVGIVFAILRWAGALKRVKLKDLRLLLSNDLQVAKFDGLSGLGKNWSFDVTDDSNIATEIDTILSMLSGEPDIAGLARLLVKFL
jgi:hypothetical protein